jgi:hypothetical protein
VLHSLHGHGPNLYCMNIAVIKIAYEMYSYRHCCSVFVNFWHHRKVEFVGNSKCLCEQRTCPTRCMPHSLENLHQNLSFTRSFPCRGVGTGHPGCEKCAIISPNVALERKYRGLHYNPFKCRCHTTFLHNSPSADIGTSAIR